MENKPNDDFFALTEEEKNSPAGQELETTTPPPSEPAVTPEEPTKDEEPQSESSPEPKPESVVPPKEELPAEDSVKKPKQVADEPDWKYKLRTKIWEHSKEAREATTDDAKKEAQDKAKAARKELGLKSRQEQPREPFKPDEYQDDVLSEYQDKNSMEYDRKRVETLGKMSGFASKDDIRAEAQQLIREEREVEERNKALDDFFREHEEYKNPEAQERFFHTVESYFNYQGKSYDEFRFMFDAAHNALFPDYLEDTIAKADLLKEKMKPVSFSGTTAAPAKTGDPVKDKLKKDFADKGEDVSWFLDD